MFLKETKYVAKNHLIAYTTKGSINLNFIVLKHKSDKKVFEGEHHNICLIRWKDIKSEYIVFWPNVKNSS